MSCKSRSAHPRGSRRCVPTATSGQDGRCAMLGCAGASREQASTRRGIPGRASLLQTIEERGSRQRLGRLGRHEQDPIEPVGDSRRTRGIEKGRQSRAGGLKAPRGIRAFSLSHTIAPAGAAGGPSARDRRGAVKRQDLTEDEASDDRYAQRAAELGAVAGAEGQGKCSEHRGERGHRIGRKRCRQAFRMASSADRRSSCSIL